MMSNSGYSKNGYPKLILYNGDTVIVLSPAEVRILNLDHQELVQRRGIEAALNDQVNLYQLAVQERDSSISLLKESLEIQELRASSANDLLRQVNAQLKKNARKIVWLKVQRGALGVVALGEAVVIYLQAKK